MDEVVERLARWLSSSCPAALDGLAPGLPDDAIGPLEKQLGTTLPAGLRALYRWRNGSRAGAYHAIIGRWSLAPLEEVVSTQQLMNGLADSGAFKTASWWRKTWVPFGNDTAGNHLCWDPRGSFAGAKGQVLEFWHTDHDRKVIAPSFDELLSLYVGSLEAGVWTYNAEDGLVDEGFDSFIAARCPGYPRVVIDFQGKRPAKPPPPPPHIEADLTRPPTTYTATARYASRDRIEHPQFGTGIVQQVNDATIDVHFDSGRRTLVHARSSGGLAKPPRIDHGPKTPQKV